MSEETLNRLRALTDTLIDPEVFQKLLDALPVALLVVDVDHTIKMVNTQFELLFGYPRGDILGQTFDMFLPDDLHEPHQRHVVNYFAEPHVRLMNFGQDLPGKKRDGSIIMLKISLGPVVTEHGVWTVAVITKANGDG
jgi:protein-histidine pros-kinase